MAPSGEVSFELERFEWTADDQLEVVGRWNGVRGRRVGRPALTVDAGGRRHRVSASQLSTGAADEPWHAAFAWDGERGEIAGAELELGRSLVVELPPPRRRRRRRSAEGDAHAEVEELRALIADLRAEIGALQAENQRLAAERSGFDEQAGQELAGLRLAHGSLKAAHEQLEDELEELRSVRDERDELAGQLTQLRAQTGDSEQERTQLGELMRELQERTSQAEAGRERLTAELAVAREDVTRLQGLLGDQEESLNAARAEAEQRIDSERAATTEVHGRLATAREEAQRTMAAEAEETERLRQELAQARADSERLLGAERAEVARLREELVSRPVAGDEEGDAESDESSRRMLERVARDLERERATSRHLRRELDALRSESADQRRAVSSATANGTLAMDEPPVAATAAGRSGAGRAVRTPEGTQRRVDAARNAAAQRVPRVPPSPVSLWAVRIVAALVVALLGVALVILVSIVT